MSKPIAFTLDKLGIKKDDTPFFPLPLRLLESDAWQGQSIKCRRLIEFLILEHLRHGGQENGNLIATYDQLVAFGIGRQYVHKAISEAEGRGLILAERGGRKGFVNHHNTFTLTFAPVREVDGHGRRCYVQPTHNWRFFIVSENSESP